MEVEMKMKMEMEMETGGCGFAVIRTFPSTTAGDAGPGVEWADNRWTPKRRQVVSSVAPLHKRQPLEAACPDSRVKALDNHGLV